MEISVPGKGGHHGEPEIVRAESRFHSRSPASQVGAVQAQARHAAHLAAQVGQGIKAYPTRSLLLWIAAVGGVRLGLALSFSGYLGVDGGAYILGYQETTTGAEALTTFARPPLAPGWILYPFMQWIGGPTGYNLYSAVMGMAILPPFYLLARQTLGRSWAAIATGAVSIDWSLGAEMFVTGVVPLLGFGMLTLALWGMIGLSRDAKPLHWLAIIVGIPMAAFVNHTAVGIGLVSLPIAWAMLPNKRVVAGALTLGALAALTALPYYLDVLPGQPRVSYPGPLVDLHQWQSSSHYLLAIAALAIGATTLKRNIPTPVKIMGTLLMVHGVLNVFISHDETLMNIFYRSGLWMMVPLWIVIAYQARAVIARVDIPRAAAVAGVAAFLALGWYGFQDSFYGQAYYSDLAGPDVLAALESIPPGEITRIGTNAESRGFYLAALSGAPVVWVQNGLPAASYATAEREGRCSLGWLECDSHAYVSHWLIDLKRTQTITVSNDRAPNPDDPWGDVGANAPWLEKTFERGTVQVWSLR